MIRSFLALALPLALRGVVAHGFVESWVIDGTSYDGFQPSYDKRFKSSAERPTDNKNHGWAEPNSTMIACGGLSPGEGLDTWDIKDGSSVTANWDNWIQGHRGKHIHAAGAMGYGTWESTYPTGPIMEYMAECPTGDCNGVDAFSLDWFKISEASWDGTQWPTEQVNQTKSWTFSIPQGVKSGAYLVRHEIVAMHIPGSPQVYPVCFQANLVSSGTGTPNETVTFPDAYAKFDQRFREIDIYWEGNPKNPAIFVPPGPRIASLGGSLALDTPAVSTTLSDAVSVGSIVVGGHISTSTATALPISDVEAVSTGPVESAPAYAVTDSAATDYTAPQESKAAVSAGDTSSQSGTHAQSIATGRGGRSRGSRCRAGSRTRAPSDTEPTLSAARRSLRSP